MIIDAYSRIRVSHLVELYEQGAFAYVCDGDNRGVSVETEE